ncbi:MAG: hypothetical protein PHT69_05565 [Bacteroidales bacterium]|nr:hypothetical protein [Bacteroidales bacterium]
MFKFFFKHKSISNVSAFIYLWVVYQLILLPFSSDIGYSFNIFLKVNLTLFLFLAAFKIGSVNIEWPKLVNSIVFILVLFVLYTIVNSVFKLTPAQYVKEGEESDFSTGGIAGSSLFTISYVLLFLPLIVSHVSPFKKKIVIFFGIIAFVILLLSLRRTTIIILIIGYLIHIFFARKYIGRAIGIAFFVLLALFILFPFFYPMLESRFELRSDRFEEDAYLNEGRFIETVYITDEVFTFEDIKYSFFGKEIWNSVGNYAGGFYGNRQIHVDYMNILNGSGLLGLTLYLLIFIVMFIEYLKVKPPNSNKNLNNNYTLLIKSTFISFFIAILLTSFSGQMYGITHRGISLTVLGLCLGYLRNEKVKVKQNLPLK